MHLPTLNNKTMDLLRVFWLHHLHPTIRAGIQDFMVLLRDALLQRVDTLQGAATQALSQSSFATQPPPDRPTTNKVM